MRSTRTNADAAWRDRTALGPAVCRTWQSALCRVVLQQIVRQQLARRSRRPGQRPLRAISVSLDPLRAIDEMTMLQNIMLRTQPEASQHPSFCSMSCRADAHLRPKRAAARCRRSYEKTHICFSVLGSGVRPLRRHRCLQPHFSVAAATLVRPRHGGAEGRTSGKSSIPLIHLRAPVV